jgi:hypothetical protein
VTPRIHAWATWTPDAGPPIDGLGLRDATRCLRAAAHVLAALDVRIWADHALVVGSTTGDPSAPAGTAALAHVPLRLADALGPRSITSICAGIDTVPMSLIETLCRLHTCDRAVLLVVEPTPAAELAVAFAIENAPGAGAFRLDRMPQIAAKTTSAGRNPCRPAQELARALAERRASMHLGDRWTIAFSWLDAAGNPQ